MGQKVHWEWEEWIGDVESSASSTGDSFRLAAGCLRSPCGSCSKAGTAATAPPVPTLLIIRTIVRMLFPSALATYSCVWPVCTSRTTAWYRQGWYVVGILGHCMTGRSAGASAQELQSWLKSTLFGFEIVRFFFFEIFEFVDLNHTTLPVYSVVY